MFLVFLLVLAMFSFASGSPRNLAVMDISSNHPGFNAADLAALTNRLEAELQSTKVFRIVERRDMASIMQEQGFQQSGACTESDCQVKVGQLLGVDLILSGTLQQLDGVVSLTVKMVNVESGVVEKSHIIDIEGNLQDMVRAGCAEMAQIMAGKKQPEGERQVLTVKKASVWPWVIGGIAIVGVGVTVALLLTQDDSSSGDRGTGNGFDEE